MIVCDLVMWTRDGMETLPQVLRKIETVVPHEAVNQKIVVDDHSTDDTWDIAESFGWRVVSSRGRGISDGANTALSMVESPFFVSFEQDLLLADDWWRKIPRLVEIRDVAVASGMRFANKPVGLMKLQRYVAKKYLGDKKLSSWLRSREMAAFTLGKTLDNTIYRTRVMQSLGFPKMKVNAGVDVVLAYEIQQSGYQWVVDYNVQSVHLRKGLHDELNHQRLYGAQQCDVSRKIPEETGKPPPITKLTAATRFFMSPFTGVFMAVKTCEPSIIYVHPLMRFAYLKGFLGAK